LIDKFFFASAFFSFFFFFPIITTISNSGFASKKTHTHTLTNELALHFLEERETDDDDDDTNHIMQVASFYFIFIQTLLIHLDATVLYQNDYEPRVFDYLPLNCYDCLSYRDIILTQLNDVPARSFADFHLGSRDTSMILNGQTKLILHPYAFQSLVVRKPNHTLTITLTAPNSWLNLTENTFHGLELYPYSTLRIIIKYFYGCTFHSNVLSGIQMGESSRLIIDVSSITEVHFEKQIMKENDLNSSIEFLISRTDTIHFEPYSFANLNLRANEQLAFHFEFISHINFKSHSFQSLKFSRSSSFRFYSIFLNRLTIEPYAFANLEFDSNTIWNFTLRTLGTCLCLKSYSFANLQTKISSENVRILFHFVALRGLSFLSQTFSNLSLHHPTNQLQILSINSLNDPNPIVHFASQSIQSQTTGQIQMNFSQITIVRFEQHSLPSRNSIVRFSFKDIAFLDLSTLNSNQQFDFNRIQYIKWNSLVVSSLITHNLNYLSNSSCMIYSAPRNSLWKLTNLNSTICNCPLLYAYKHGQLDGQLIPCLNSLTGDETARLMLECDFDKRKFLCDKTLDFLMDLNSTTSEYHPSIEFDHRQLLDRNYLSCSYNYSSYVSRSIVRTRFLNHFSFVIGMILFVFIFLLILVVALLNGLQYKMREYDETWTWRRNMSWTTLRRTISQTSLRRSRRDLRSINRQDLTSKSDNQLDRLRHDHDLKQSQSIQEELKL